MIKFAELDSNNKVINIIIGTEASIIGIPGTFIKCTDSTKDAVIGCTYNTDSNVFIPEKPYPSWTLNENNEWQPPVDRPSPGTPYTWDESNQSWIELDLVEIDLP